MVEAFAVIVEMSFVLIENWLVIVDVSRFTGIVPVAPVAPVSPWLPVAPGNPVAPDKP